MADCVAHSPPVPLLGPRQQRREADVDGGGEEHDDEEGRPVEAALVHVEDSPRQRVVLREAAVEPEDARAAEEHRDGDHDGRRECEALLDGREEGQRLYDPRARDRGGAPERERGEKIAPPPPIRPAVTYTRADYRSQRERSHPTHGVRLRVRVPL